MLFLVSVLALVLSLSGKEAIVASSTLNLSPAVYEYYRAHAGREPDVLADLRAETASLGGDAVMQIAPEQGAFMGLLVKLLGVRSVLEFGTFTGYSSLAMALAGATDITTIDVSEDFTAIARRAWQKAGVADRINLRLDGGLSAIPALAAEGRAATFDLAFIDADKLNYDAYYEGALKLVRTGGLILIDNVLWGGDVANPAAKDAESEMFRRLNKKVLSDSRVEMAMLPIGDGLTLVRKV